MKSKGKKKDTAKISGVPEEEENNLGPTPLPWPSQFMLDGIVLCK